MRAAPQSHNDDVLGIAGEGRVRRADSQAARGAARPSTPAQRPPRPAPLAQPLAALQETIVQTYDPWIPVVVGCLMTLGVVMVYSASVSLKGEGFRWHEIWNSPLRQGLFAAAGFVAMVIAAQIDYRLFAWEKRGDGIWIAGFYMLALGLCAAVLVPGIGQEQKGSVRWLPLPGGLNFQPSELAKLALVVWLAAFFTRPDADARSFARGFFPAAASGGLLVALVGKEDLGTAALMGIVMMALMALAGVRWLYLGGVGLLGLLGGVLLVWIEPYRMRRITTFFSEAPDPRAEGYQVMQSLIAIANGGWWGRGLGASVQKYDYLPQDNTDFILAILCEELGIAGGIVVVALFLFLLLRGLMIAERAMTPFGRLLASGIALTLCIQAAINIGVVTNSLPTKGISLPFVSAGGSGVIFLGLSAGLLAAVGRRSAIARAV